MLSCFGMRKKSSSHGDTEPLLPQYEDDTALQKSVHQKLHSYQMMRALTKGYMPSNEQVIINLRTLLASDVLNPEAAGLSGSGWQLMKHNKQWLSEFIDLMRNKNDRDQIQDFVWFLLHANISVNTQDIIQTASSTRARADAVAAYESIKTVGSLLLTNSDFRLFLSDLNTIGRQVFADTANKLSAVAEDAANTIEPSTENSEALKNPEMEGEAAPTIDDLEAQASEIGRVVSNGIKVTGKEAGQSLQENVSGDQKDTLLFRLKAVVTKLTKRNDYSDSVSTIGLLIKRYVMVYSRAADNTISTIQEDVDTNDELDRALKNAWSLLSSFGDKEAWKELELRANRVMEHSQKDPEFENLMDNVATSIQKMLTEPDFFDSAGDKIDELKQKSKDVGMESPLRQDIKNMMQQGRIAFDSVMNDEDISKLFKTSLKIWAILSPANTITNPELLVDTYNVFIPLLIQAVQYIPIPRLEVSVPEVDLLLENLILEPGRTINHSSFLPFKLNIQTLNDLSIHKHRLRTISSLTTLITINIKGLSFRADEVGFWLRAHSGLLRLADEGIASFKLDDRGIDISLDIEVGKDRLEKMISLRDVRVKIHHLSYTLRKSKFSLLAWLFKPLLRPIIRKTLEHQLSTTIADTLHAANRELLFARERLRATRISDPQDIKTYIKAIITRLVPEEDPDMYTNLGVTGGSNVKGNVFAGVYAPGSVVKLWNEEAASAGTRVDEEATRGWRNDIFDVPVRSMV